MQPLKEYAGENNHITKNQIDSIKLVAKNYIPSEVSALDTIIIETTKGIIKLKIFSDAAPAHCLNFKKLANSGYYDNTTFHRVIKDFMIQGGDILSRDSDRDNDSFTNMYGKDAEFINATNMMQVAKTMNKKFLEK